MSLWDDLPSDVRNTGALDPLEDALRAMDTAGLTPRETTDVDGTWSVRSVAVDVPQLAGVSVDPATGRWGGAGSSTPIELTGTQATIAYGRHLTGPGGTEDGGWHLDLDVPGIRLLVPYLRGAMLDTRGQLVFDPANPQVRFILPRIVIRTMQLAGATVGTRLRSASTSGNPVDDIYSFIRMTPGHALIGPGNTVGFAFRTAELDLSALADPPGLPPGARAVPGEWQGLHLPEVRLFVAPDGLEGLAVSAGVRDLWIGIGVHDGVTGAFSAEVVNRGGSPTVLARFISPAGRHIAAVAGGAVEAPDQSVFLVDASGGLAPHTIRIQVVGGPTVAGDRLPVTVPAAGTVELRVTVTDAGGNSHSPASFRALRPAAGEGAAPALANPAALRLLTPERGRMVIVSQTAADVTVRLDPDVPADWAWPGGNSTGTRATVPVMAGSTAAVSGTPTQPADARPTTLDCYFRFNHPFPSETTDAWWRNPSNTGSAPASGQTAAPAGQAFTDLARSRQADIGATPLVVDGYASYEGNDTPTKRTSNLELSRRRLDAAVEILRDLGYTATAGTPHGHADARDHTPLNPPEAAPAETSGEWWLARARAAAPPAPETVRAELSRPAASQPPGQRDPQPPDTGRPDCFRRLGVEVELIRTTFVRLEIWGEFDVQTAIEASLDEGGQPPLGGRGANPGDGLCAFRVRLRLATDRESWQVFGEFRALEADLDGLWEGRHTDAGIDAGSLNVLGALAVMGPLAAGAADLSPAAGTLVQLGSVALGASSLVRTRILTLRGAEVMVSDGVIAPDGSTASDRGTQVSVLLDVEVQFWFDLAVIRVPEDRPIRTRYKAVGVRSEWGTGTEVEYVPIPVFDPNRGYELDIQPGSLIAKPPLDEILRVFGVRVSRDNPTYLEVEAGIDVPLGPVTVDTIRVRARLDAVELPQLTKLGATLDIPGTVHGAGSIELTGAGFKAAFDLTIVPLSVRAAATLAIETKAGVTGLLIGVEVEFPAPLPLGNSGLALYGLLGGVGVNYARLENPAARVPALDWLMAQLAPPRKSVMHPDGWTHTAGSFAVAAGLLLGTTEGGFILHLKGIILIEVPGPRLLLVMKADVLSLPPALGSAQEATFLAVLDIDFGAGTITVGVVADYSIERILRIHVPVTAFFDARNPEKWLVDLGSYDDRVTVKVLDVFTGTGYLMVHGDGIALPPLPATTGLSVATGFHIQAVLMGSKAARLYVEAAAGFDAVLGFDPFFLAGKVYVRGELRLFIVSIGVSAELTLMVGTRIQDGVPRDDPYLHGEVCGRVDFFFFSVKGCVGITIGHEPDPDPPVRDLVAGLSLAGRTPALLEGTAGRPADSTVGHAAGVDGAIVHGEVPTVPLDAVPVLRFQAAPDAEGLSVLGQAPLGSTGAAGPGAWRRIGERWWAYKVTGVTLSGALTAGMTPSVWWSASAPGSSTAEPPALALLHWLPTPFTSTVTYGEVLREQVEHRWGTVCRPAAPPQPQLWTFLGEALGPSATGWRLDPVLWPDPDGLLRTAPAGRRLRVTEQWRTGDAAADLLAGGAPAEVAGDAVACPTDRTPPEDPFSRWGQDNGPLDPTTWAGAGAATYAELAGLLAAGATVNDVAGHWLERSPDPEAGRLKGCEGRILASPVRTDGEPLTGSRADRELVERARQEAGWRPDPLADAVAFSLGEDLAAFDLLLLVPREKHRTLLVEVRSAAGEALDRREVDWAAMVGPANPLPKRWVAHDGPWAEPVELAGRMAAKIAGADRDRPMPALIRWEELPEGAAAVVVGWGQEHGQRIRAQRYWVVAAAGLSRAEVRRYEYDETVVSRDRDALETGLRQDPSDHALLKPGQTYDVTVGWTYDVETGDEVPTRTPSFADEHTQTFRFATAPASEVPADLGPWLLDTNPGMGDAGVFCREPLRITLATQNVLRLFDAYDHRLEVTVLASSGHHPVPPGGGVAGQALVLPVEAVLAAGSVLQPKANAVVLNPWDRAVGELVDALECIEAGNVTREVEEIVLAYELEPLTDYLLDIHAVPAGGAGPRRRVHRANFTTSRFDGPDHLASWIAPAPIDHRLVRDAAPLAGLPDRPTGREWDDAVQLAGLPVPQTPSAPAVQVWWSADAVPQPLAVVIECSEQLVRERVMPVQLSSPPDGVDPSHAWWAARPATWLDVRPAATPPDPGAAASVGRVVRGPGGTRAMVLLAAGQRGRRLTLELVQAPDPLAADPGRAVTIVDVTLTGAPWEVEF
ncbi:hypothetical protein FJ661_02460 [Pseudarthrobacter phenanthrenivorans]|uniref:DUF6603 domain-containing protein n=1 Tax=Pseudarthrobacter phenanthrenivorans TaxID=361575 RepID=UPI00112C919D|nr:DUF6603 domain-containing protein [Pseudarthrobacter phenanthrenivorans]TPV53463.1 hypothetical protein FJ661_02460 [Pseudarthrobacter phenanthrenivorans]